jgi:hypothetical protein
MIHAEWHHALFGPDALEGELEESPPITGGIATVGG